MFYISLGVRERVGVQLLALISDRTSLELAIPYENLALQGQFQLCNADIYTSR